MKTCSQCGIPKDIGEFYRHKSSTDGRQSHCKECDRKRSGGRFRMAYADRSRNSNEYVRPPARQKLCKVCFGLAHRVLGKRCKGRFPDGRLCGLERRENAQA